MSTFVKLAQYGELHIVECVLFAATHYLGLHGDSVGDNKNNTATAEGGYVLIIAFGNPIGSLAKASSFLLVLGPHLPTGLSLLSLPVDYGIFNQVFFCAQGNLPIQIGQFFLISPL